MHVISTTGPDNATKAVLPFIAAKGAMSQDDEVDLFLMQEATYLGSRSHANPFQVTAPGLPSVGDVIEALVDGEAIRSAIVCKPCADAREIDPNQLWHWAEFGGAPDLAIQAERNDTTVTF